MLDRPSTADRGRRRGRGTNLPAVVVLVVVSTVPLEFNAHLDNAVDAPNVVRRS